ncbi:sulfite exporter TauE/SafE family protein [Suttonella ornithocola]|uniref:Probable membrane transporter protein n=1 Tax=Suttonella ornithocola TaxID=279832 RepID=A0A380MYA7_9GAMM|nr:sulfite exporter TauE/SafE family protein [Suttonella ornithocola]SUO97282.1 Sulfite exporter TauE/SafE [Suttonella ornithocola]
MDFSPYIYPAIFLLAIIAGVVNILAGGGSNLILPLLMVFGLDPQTANATNRVGIWFQGIAGLFGFAKKGKVPTHDLPAIFIPTLIGGAVGALLAAKLPILLALSSFTANLNQQTLVKIILLGTMLIVAAMMLFKPATIMYPEGQARLMKKTPVAWIWLFIGGIYGGFVQAGVGFVLITTFASILHYDLVHSNALKLACTMIFTTIALAIFIWEGQVLWLVGFVLALGNAIGALLGVRFAVAISPNTMRWILFAMTLTAVIAALIF